MGHKLVERVLGPVDPEAQAVGNVYKRARALFTSAAIALGVSIMLPYWELKLVAPQFPQGLRVTAWVNRLEGDVAELESLNHYIGLPSFADGATFERSVAIAGILLLVGLLAAGIYIRNRWVLAFALPAVLFPAVFLADLQFWLWKYGHSLDPRAPFSSAVGEFTPKVFGPGEIAQFETLAWPGTGLLAALAASVLTALGLLAHRRASLRSVGDQVPAAVHGCSVCRVANKRAGRTPTTAKLCAQCLHINHKLARSLPIAPQSTTETVDVERPTGHLLDNKGR